MAVASKYAAYTRVPAVPRALGIQHDPTRSGAPVGEPHFVLAHAQQCASKACSLMDALNALPLPAQACCLFLHASLQLCLAHFPSINGWVSVSTPVVEAGGRALKSAFVIMDRQLAMDVVHRVGAATLSQGNRM
jgi:hypothetical protein